MKYFTAALFVILTPLVLQAAEPITLADNSPVQPRFFPLDGMRSGQQPNVKVKSNPTLRPANALRSDANAMHNGFFRIDRKTATAAAQPLVLRLPGNRPAADAPRVILGATPAASTAATETTSASLSTPNNIDPVLALFNNTADGKLPSFRDALSGRQGSSTTGVGGAHAWPLPLDAAQKISSAYGYRADPLNRKLGFHGGVDIAAKTGTPVLASADGQVVKAGSDGLYGQSISLLHRDGTESQYGHLSGQNVTVGQQVKAGQQIGLVGATGRVTGAHLDYRLSRDGVTLDPLKVLNRPTTVAMETPAHTPTVTASAAAPASLSESHAHPTSPMVTRPRQLAKSERLIVVR